MYRHGLVSIVFLVLPLANIGYAQTAEQQQVSGHTAYIQGIEAFENEDYQDAIRLLSEAYTKLPNSSGVNFALADAYLQMGDLSNALYYAKQAAEMEPSNKWYGLKLAEIYRLNGQNQSAIAEYKTILRHHQKDRQVLQQLARTLENDNRLLEANRIYQKLLTGSDTDIPLRLKKAANFQKLGMKDSVIAEVKNIRSLNPRDPATLQILSDIYLELDNTPEAKNMLLQALILNGNDSQSRIKLADVYAAQAQWDSVETTLNDMLKDSLISPDTKLTVAQYILSKYNAQPSDSAVVNVTSVLLNSLTKNEPDYAQAHRLAAKFFVQTNQPQKALEALAKTNQLQPSDDEAWRQRLQLLLKQKNFREIIELAPAAQKNVPQDPFVLYFVGNAYLETGDFTIAIDKLGEAVRYPARRNFKSLIYTALGKAHFNASNLDKAVKSFDDALKWDANNAEAMEHLGNVYAKRDKPKQAKEWWEKALEKDPARSHLKSKISQ